MGSECPDEYWTPLYLKSWVKSLMILYFIQNLKSLNIPDKNKHLKYAAQSNTFIILNKGQFLIGTDILTMCENLEEFMGSSIECYRNLFPTCLKI